MLKLFFKNRFLCSIFLLIIVSSCKQERDHSIIVHLVPNNYEGPLIESLQKTGKSLRQEGDTIYIDYDERGVAIYKDTVVHFSGIEEKYIYVRNGKKTKVELDINDKEIYHGICLNGTPFYSVIVRNKSSISFSKLQKDLVKKYICNN